MNKYDTIISDVTAEMDKAEARWGVEFDNKNTLNDWASYIMIYLARATSMGQPAPTVRSALVKTAGLALRALYYYDNGKMPKRHYDK